MTRKRSNSLIPIEFRNDTSDGGIERAALATVFGVKEYTESKIFWNEDDNNSHKLFLPAVARKNSYITTSSSSSTTLKQEKKSLPSIPVVSTFDDFWAETTFSPKKNTLSQTPPLLPSPCNLSIPADLSDLPMNLFDLLVSDDNPNIILWSSIQSTPHYTAADQQGEDGKKSKWLPNTLRKKLSTPNIQEKVVIQQHRIIEAATIEKLVEKLTITLDYTFMTDFFLIFRVFMTPLQLCKFLILRFKWSLEKSDESRCIVRIRTFVVMRHWLLNYFLHDFVPNKELRIKMTEFLNEMPSHPVIKQSVRDQRIIKGLKRVVRRLKKLYYASSSSSSRVKVIDPPPPTAHQQRMTALAQEKLLKNSSIRQRTLNIVNGIHVDTRHGDNTAIRDQQRAPVVVIGTTYPKSPLNRNSLPENSTASTRRGSSTSSKPSNHQHKSSLSSSVYMNENNNKQHHEDFRIMSNISDSSLESEVSPGASDVEDYEYHHGDDEEVYELESPYGNSSIQSITQQPIATTSHISHVSSDQLTQKLEQLLQQKQGLDTRPRSFYSAQLAIPSNIPTPDIIYPITSNNNLINSTSYNSMAYPSVTESEAVTPPIEADPVSVLKSAYSNDGLLSTGSTSKRTSSIDPKIKPLPALSTTTTEEDDDNITAKSKSFASSISSYAKIKPLPAHQHDESWKLSMPKKPVENKPKSRITEIIDIHSSPHQQTILQLPSLATPKTTFSSIILKYPTSLIAQQLCLIEKAILLDINWEELVDCQWTRMSTSSEDYHPQQETNTNNTVPEQQGIYSRTKRMKQQNEKNNPERGIEKAINRFNAVCQWVSSEIVQTRSIQQRVKVIEKFIRLAKKCKLYCNFSTLIQILLGLQSSSVSRLEKTWSKVDKRILKTLHELSSFTSPTKNWKQIRDSMSQVAEEYGESPTEIQVEVDTHKKQQLNNSSNTVVRIKLPFGGCIPFLGIYLSDLVFNAELPSYLPPSTIQPDDPMKVLSQPLVHFRKHRVTATVIKRVLLFQNLAKRYSFEETQDSTLYSACFHVHSLDMNTIQRLSYEIEP